MDEYHYFKSEETNKLFFYWIKNEPQAFGGTVLEFFTDLVVSILDNDENLDSSFIRQSKSMLKDWQIESYMEKFYSMKAMYDKLKYRFRDE
ncbi:MAG: hypothetical protein H6Q14_1969 [Bacteroidetes bacterium]|nr:hypothetical protein [Bacteroidota bacterium]